MNEEVKWGKRMQNKKVRGGRKEEVGEVRMR